MITAVSVVSALMTYTNGARRTFRNIIISFCWARAVACTHNSRAQTAHRNARNRLTTNCFRFAVRPLKMLLNRPIVTCSSFALISGNATNTIMPSVRRVSSKDAVSGRLNRFRPSTSTTVIIIRRKTITARMAARAISIGRKPAM